MEKFKSIEKIGDGTYGTVLKSINTETNQIVAIKKMKKQYSKWDECVSMKEVKALVGLKHPNIITLNEMVLENSELFLVFEHIGQNLYEYTQKQTKNLSEMKIRNVIYQILQGLAYMHRQNYFHRDMKPENILIHGDIVKIADFGLAKEIRSKPPYTEYVSTRWYRSPEVILKSKNYNSPIDVFAVGAIMAELYNNKPLFPGKSEYDQLKKICEVLGSPSNSEWPEGIVLASKLNFKFPTSKGQKLRNIIPRASDSAINLLENILNFNPIKRLTASQCLQHPFFQCFDLLSVYGLKVNYSLSQGNLYNLSKEASLDSNFNSNSNVNFNNNNNTNNDNYASNSNTINSNSMGNNQLKNREAVFGNYNSGSNLISDVNEKKKIKSSNTGPNYNMSSALKAASVTGTAALLKKNSLLNPTNKDLKGDNFAIFSNLNTKTTILDFNKTAFLTNAAKDSSSGVTGVNKLTEKEKDIHYISVRKLGKNKADELN